MGSIIFRIPLCLCPLSNTLTLFGCHSPGVIGILNTVDPLALVSNYYLEAMHSLNSIIMIELSESIAFVKSLKQMKTQKSMIL